MPLILSPAILFGVAVLVVLTVLGLVVLARWLRHQFYHQRRWEVLLLNPKTVGDEPIKFVQSLKPPFVLEIVIHLLGREVNYYLAVPAARANRLKKRLAARQAEDYAVHYAGGTNLGFYFKKDSPEPRFDLKKIDSSAINEIGEAVVLQLVGQEKRGKNLVANLRLLITAPSPYRAKEILAGLKPAFFGLKRIEVANLDFFHRLIFREFSPKEAILLD
jgi:hypothetical protein